MATDAPSPPEGFEAFEPSGGDDDDERPEVKLDPGEVLTGTVLRVRDGENEHGDWYELLVKDESRGVVRYYAKGQVKRACREDRIEEGVELWVTVSTETESFTRDDGSDVEYNPTECFLGGA